MLGDADVFVLPSVPTREGKREGIPVALMEAMASCLPVVASDLSGIPELVESGVSGYLVSPGDHRDLARCLRLLSRNPRSRREMGIAGRRRVRRHFDLKKNVARLAWLFNESPTAAANSMSSLSQHHPEATHELQTG
jgi:glycosyltransferase involved in cell wall biosynthesis